MGAQFAEYAIGYPLDAGVLAVDRIAPNPPHTRSAVLIHGPSGRKQALTTDDTAPGTGENTLSGNPDKPDPIKSALQGEHLLIGSKPSGRHDHTYR